MFGNGLLMKFEKLLLFSFVSCCQMCHRAGREKTASFPVFFLKKKKERETRGSDVMNGRNLQSATLYKISSNWFLSLYMSLRFWYKSKSLRSTESE